MNGIEALFGDYTIRTVSLGCAALGAVSGALGSMAVLRRQSLMGDAMSHAALPGIAAAFLLTRAKDPLVLLLGAAVAAWLGTLLFLAVVQSPRITSDSALGIVLSVFFGLGLMLLTIIQKLPDATQAGLDKFLFGQSATLLTKDVITIVVLGAIAVGSQLLLWKELKVATFDRDFAGSQGLPVKLLDVLFTSILVIAVVVGLQAVGVVLMSALIVAPAAAARQWTNSLGRMVGIAAGFGALSGVTGAVVSASAPGLPTGPLVVLAASALVVVSLFFAPSRGLVTAWFRRRRHGRAIQREQILADLYALSFQHEDTSHAHDAKALRAMRPWRKGSLKGALESLASEGWIERHHAGWRLTTAGKDRAESYARRVGFEPREAAS